MEPTLNHEGRVCGYRELDTAEPTQDAAMPEAPTCERCRGVMIADDEMGRSWHCIAACEKDAESKLRQVEYVLERMVSFVMTKPSPQQTRAKTPREMVELFASDLRVALSPSQTTETP